MIFLAAREKKQAATRRFFALYWERTLRRVRSVLAPKDRDLFAEEITQAVLARALDAPFDCEKAGTSIWPWLARIAGRMVYDHYRRLQVNQTAVNESTYLRRVHSGRTKVDMDQVRTALLGCLGKIEEDNRIAFVLSYADNLSPVAVGQIFGWSTTYTSARLSRTRKALEKCMSASGLNFRSRGPWKEMTASKA